MGFDLLKPAVLFSVKQTCCCWRCYCELWNLPLQQVLQYCWGDSSPWCWFHVRFRRFVCGPENSINLMNVYSKCGCKCLGTSSALLVYLQLLSQQTVATDSLSHLVGHIRRRWLESPTGLGWCRMPFLAGPFVSICLPAAFVCSNVCHFHPWEFWGLSMVGLVLIADRIVSIGWCHYCLMHIFHPVCLGSAILGSNCFSDHRSCHFQVGFSDRMYRWAELGMASSTRSHRAHRNSFCHTCIFRLSARTCRAMSWRCCRACLPSSSWVLLGVAIKDTN